MDQMLCLKCIAFKGTVAAGMTKSAQSHTKPVELEAEDDDTSGIVMRTQISLPSPECYYRFLSVDLAQVVYLFLFVISWQFSCP